MRKQAKAQDGKQKLTVKDLPAGRKAGSVKGGSIAPDNEHEVAGAAAVQAEASR